ncbi:hypothetical protein TPY_2739 [Sulfobacillus acidophilus TPY]|uniref:Uncharacterized protein n=1 Tax=Sulfobacillus acidophilus (strain ATCC 700253 / DSM 10332 / NAL) TaxID=679936 RepID=G8TUJ5_SULAD|nr:hypothetical protein TPY_2739 [Sulfobacillus acidophilus TPY]AEW04642.1 hypothetical protein Sulac_1142 [Sulfobacillus acidophilus DSM 10332]
MKHQPASQCPRCRQSDLLMYQDRTTGDWWAFCEACQYDFAVDSPPSVAVTSSPKTRR